MIDPQKKCIWTTRKTTELTYKNNEFIGTGISLRVLLHAFVDTNFIWYSKTHGDFDDNVKLRCNGNGKSYFILYYFNACSIFYKSINDYFLVLL